MLTDFPEFIKQAAAVKPEKRQLDWFNTEFYAFIHFTVNTYTDREWGLGNEEESIFNPVELDCDQWARALKSAGMKGMVLTAKHHDGFCLWPSKYTEHCVKNSPYKNGKGDIVKEASDACRRHGLKFGIYLSPWDRNSKYYGTDEYNDYYKAQLTELLTNYGELFMVWFDGACGEGPNGKKQVYDYQGYIDLIRKYQPNACIFSDHGPDVRWCGNEAGQTRNAEWAIVPKELAYFAEPQTGHGPLEGNMNFINATHKTIGELSSILYSEGLCFNGAEVNMSIRPGWFYHENEKAYSVDKLFDTYLRAVGGNACFHLNIPPMPNGKFNDNDVKTLEELGERIRTIFGNPLSVKSIERKADSETATQCVFHVSLQEKQKISYIVLKENICEGQKVEAFFLALDTYFPFAQGTTIGHKKIIRLESPVEVDCFDIYITSARDVVNELKIELY